MSHPSYWKKINCFHVDPTETWCLAGNLFGELLIIDIDSFSVVRELRAAAGSIEAVHVHRTQPYLAALSADQHVAICRYDGTQLELIHRIPLREIMAENHEPFPAGNSNSQALWFHPHDLRLLTKNGSGASVEIAFDDDEWKALWCHGYFANENGSEELTHIRYLEDSEHVLCASTGGLVVIDPAQRDKPVLRWSIDVQNIHYAEHVRGTEYILAHDCRSCVLIDTSGQRPARVGPKITRDDIEAITYNATSKRAFLSSFDRNVYEVDLDTCDTKGVVVQTPFKLRWLKTLERAPDTMIIQCRNGGLYKVDLAQKALVGVVKETPNSFWSAVAASDRQLYIAGEGPEVLEISALGEDQDRHETRLGSRWFKFEGAPGRFTKRTAFQRSTGTLLLARSDGDVIAARPETGESRRLANVGAAVRDIATDFATRDVFVVCEDGRAHRLDGDTGKLLASFATAEEPLWALAHNSERNVLAVAERYGDLILLDPPSMKELKRIKGLHITKRMRWLDGDRLFINVASHLYQLQVERGDLGIVIPNQGNTIEDFDWTDDRRYFATVTYHRNLAVFDMHTWERLDEALTDMDYPHGVQWLSSKRSDGCHPYELLTYGRSGVANRFRLHNDRLVAMGAVNQELSTPISREGIIVP